MNKEPYISIITFLLVIFSVTLIVMIVKPQELNKEEALEEQGISEDPIYEQTLNGNTPQRVHLYESGDDIRPDLYEVYYFPEIITNGTQGHYEIYRTLGKDRVN